MQIQPLEVIYVHDRLIRPPGPKMMVCVEPDLGFFFRINTKGHWPASILIEKRRNPFLHHDSYLQCGELIELDEFVVDEILDEKGLYGELDKSYAAAICRTLDSVSTIRKSDTDAIRQCLGN